MAMLLRQACLAEEEGKCAGGSGGVGVGGGGGHAGSRSSLGSALRGLPRFNPKPLKIF